MCCLFNGRYRRLQKIYILTSEEDNPGEPTLDKNRNWMIRSYRDKGYGAEATVILESDILVIDMWLYTVFTQNISHCLKWKCMNRAVSCTFYWVHWSSFSGWGFFVINGTRLCFGYFKIINKKYKQIKSMQLQFVEHCSFAVVITNLTNGISFFEN